MKFFKKLGTFFRSKSFFIHLGLIVIAWVVIIWGARTYFLSYTRHGETIEVPALLGNNGKDISTLIGEKELQYEILDSVYKPNLIAGTIVYQNPMPTDSSGIKVKAGRVIRLRVSKRSRLVTVPLVVSRSLRFAEEVLMSKGLRTQVQFIPSIEDQGSVIAESFKGKKIKEGVKVPINSVIKLTVGKMSLGRKTSVPDLTGLTIKEAKSRFTDGSGLNLFYVCLECETKSDSLKARIVRQTPIAGDSSMIPLGSTITVFISPDKKDVEK